MPPINRAWAKAIEEDELSQTRPKELDDINIEEGKRDLDQLKDVINANDRIFNELLFKHGTELVAEMMAVALATLYPDAKDKIYIEVPKQSGVTVATAKTDTDVEMSGALPANAAASAKKTQTPKANHVFNLKPLTRTSSGAEVPTSSKKRYAANTQDTPSKSPKMRTPSLRG